MTTSSFCANCGAPLAPGTRFCDSCGTPVAESPAAYAPPPPSYQPAPPPPPAPSAGGVYCPACGATNAPGARFCNTCGANMSAPAAQQAAPQYAAPAPAQQAGSTRVSWAWWLMPLFLTWLGGVIAFAVVRKRNKGTATALLIVGILMPIVWWLVFFRAC
jgi:hypothetical protein